MSSKRSRGRRSGSSSARAQRRQGHPARQAEQRREHEQQAQDRAQRAARARGALDPPIRGALDPTGDELVGDAVARLREIVRDVDDPLVAASLGSELCAPWALGDLEHADDDHDAESEIGVRIVHTTATAGDATALAVLRAIELGATELTAVAAAFAATRLATTVPDPAWYHPTSELTCTGAGVLHEGDFDDGETLLFSFTGPGHDEHVIGVYVDRNLGGIAKDLLVGPPLRQIADQVRQTAGTGEFAQVRLDAIDPTDAKARAALAMARTHLTFQPPVGEDVPALWALATQRMKLVPGDVPPEAVDDEQRVPDDERGRLLEAFFASRHAPERTEDTVGIVGVAIDFACDAMDGDPVRWSPVVVELFMVDWLPRKVTFPEQTIAQVPDVLRAWIRFAGERRGTRLQAIDQTVAAVAEWEHELRAAASDPERWGPAKMIGQAMQDANVDFSDETAIERFIDEYNTGLPDVGPPTDMDPELRRGLARLVGAVEPLPTRVPGAPALEPIDPSALRVPVALRPRVEQIVDHADAVALAVLDAEYARIAREIVARLARRRPSPLVRGRTDIWAAGALHAAGALAGLFRPDTTPYVRADELAATAGVAKGTMTAKAALIRDTLGLRAGDAAVTHPSINDLPFWLRGR